MIDNFDQISDLLEFRSDDDFYFLQIIQRKKDNPGLKGTNNNSRVIKTYYVNSKKYLLNKKDEIIDICKLFNARAGLNLNRRSYKKCSLQTARLILDQMANQDDKHAMNAFNSVCGRFSNESDKKWIIDIDTKTDKVHDNLQIGAMSMLLTPIQPKGEKAITCIETKNGYHLITKPFNIQEFKEIYPDLDIHKNNPTILYIP